MQQDQKPEYSRLAVILIILFGFAVIGLIVLTAVLWIPVFLFTLPVTIFLYFLSKYTKVSALFLMKKKRKSLSNKSTQTNLQRALRHSPCL